MADPADASHAVDAAAIEASIFHLLDRRSALSTICPSDVARALAGPEPRWRALMPQVRSVAAALAAQGRLRVTRGGVEVPAAGPGGPIRLGRPRRDP